MKSILIIAPSIRVKGGISSVLRGYIDTELATKFRLMLIPTHIDGPKLKKLIVAAFALFKTLIFLISKKIDIVHLHCGNYPSPIRKLFHFYLSNLFKISTIFHIHGGMFAQQHKKLKPFLRRQVEWMLNRTDVVVCLTESWKEEIKKLFPFANIVVVPNGVRPISSQTFRSTHGHRGKTCRICYMGAIKEKKGIFDLITVCKWMAENGILFELVICGDGSLSVLRKLIEKHKLSERITLLGWVEGKNKEEVFLSSDLLVLPSYSEAMPMAILEAMAYGLPVVSTEIGGIPEIVAEGQSGFLVRPGDTIGLYKRLTAFISDSAKRKQSGEYGRKIVENKYNLKRTISQISELYDQC